MQNASTLERSLENTENSLQYKLGYYIPVVNAVLQHNGLAKTGVTSKANLIWNPKMKDLEHFTKLGPHQKINHFPNSLQLGRKDCLNKNIFHMQTRFAKDYSFLPRSYILPQEEPVLIEVLFNNAALPEKEIFVDLLYREAKSQLAR